MSDRLNRLCFLAPLLMALAIGAKPPVVAHPAKPSSTPAGFFVPATRPRSRYVIDARIDLKAGVLEGRQTITLVNRSPRTLSRIALDWDLNDVRI